MDLNVLIRGQSNALLFADRGGARALEQGLEARLGVDVHLLAEWGTDSSTIHSATAFMDWDTGGQQASLLRYVHELPADIKDNPTATVWMHNEYDQKIEGLTKDAWLGEVRTDAVKVRGELGQGAATTPYTFVPIKYPYGPSFGAIEEGMRGLDTEPGFNAEISWAAQSLAMNGGPEEGNNSSHMGDGDAAKLGESLAASMAGTLRPLASGPPMPAVSVSDATRAEGEGLVFTASLSGPTSSTVTVAYATQNGTATAGSDYAAASGTLTFAPNQTSRTFSVAGLEDAAVEVDEAFTVNLSAPTNATLGDAQGTGTVTNDDSAPAPPPPTATLPPPATGAGVGTPGRDNLRGTNAGETFTPGAGNDTVRTGGGNDVVVFREGDDVDQIADFTRGSDRVQLNLSAGSDHVDNFAELQSLLAGGQIGVSSKRNEITLSFGDGDSLTLVGVNDLAAQDWLFTG